MSTNFFLDWENNLLSDVEFESLVEDVGTNELYANRFKIKKRITKHKR